MGVLSFQPKSIITLRGREFRVMKAVGVTTLMVQDAKTKAVEVVNVTDLAVPADEPAKPAKPIDSLLVCSFMMQTGSVLVSAIDGPHAS